MPPMTWLCLLLAASGSPVPGPFPITVPVGGSVKICRTGTIVCPATAPICDDSSIAVMRAGEEGLEIVGLKAGRTLCSAASASLVRRVYAVTVKDAK